MAAQTLVLPIQPGKLEAVWQLCDLALGLRRGEYEQSRQRLGITRETLWLAAHGDLLVWVVETSDLNEALSRLVRSDLSFDRWFVRHLRDAHGIDLSRWPSAEGPAMEQIFTWPQD